MDNKYYNVHVRLHITCIYVHLDIHTCIHLFIHDVCINCSLYLNQFMYVCTCVYTCIQTCIVLVLCDSIILLCNLYGCTVEPPNSRHLAFLHTRCSSDWSVINTILKKCSNGDTSLFRNQTAFCSLNCTSTAHRSISMGRFDFSYLIYTEASSTIINRA